MQSSRHTATAAPAMMNIPDDAEEACLPPSSRVGNRVGLLVDMDARTMTVLVNGTAIPSLVFDNLPAQMYVAVTLDDNGSSVRLVD